MREEPNFKELSVVIPLHNEQESVEPLIEEIHAALGGIDYEIICIDDGSSDGTLDRLRLLSKASPRLRILHHSRKSGQSKAVWNGVRYSLSPWIATLDGDGQNDPADIPRLFARVRQGDAGKPACVCGWRRNRQDTLLKRLSSTVANYVRSRLLRDNTPDTGCGLKVFSREAFLLLPCFDHMHRFLPALFLRGGYRIESLEVNHRPRNRGESKYGLNNRLWAGIIDLLGVYWLLRRSGLSEVVEE
ncbi:MAG TPA: glycosyltransferase family 2 protein [Geobacteraceae bacterium]|nr:glycosyltransferase family 2 protein [Geobacteraceae bacterium]